MLKEINKIKKNDGEENKRWFSDDFFDLMVWQENGQISAFELSFNKADEEHSISWKKGGKLSHFRVDDGEKPGRLKQTPILITIHESGFRKIIKRFFEDSAEIDETISHFVLQILLQESALS